MRIRRVGWAALAFIALAGAVTGWHAWERLHAYHPLPPPIAVVTPELSPFQRAVMAELDRQIGANIRYHDAYYVGAEPPANEGVCTDVVIRAFRAAGVDLRKEVAADIAANRRAYGIRRPDPNVDHRRCRNLVVFFRRHARTLSASPQGDWQPGDVVFWDTYGNGRTDHVGMVGEGKDRAGNPVIVHHWPGLPVSETDGLFRFRVTGHFRWKG